MKGQAESWVDILQSESFPRLILLQKTESTRLLFPADGMWKQKQRGCQTHTTILWPVILSDKPEEVINYDLVSISTKHHYGKEIRWLTRPPWHIYEAKLSHAKEADRSRSQTDIYTHLSLLFVPFEKHQSAAYSEPHDRAIDAVFMCVIHLYVCSVGACGRNNRGEKACLYLICCCMQTLVCQTTMKVTSDGQPAALNYITLWGCLCLPETKHIHTSDMASCL